MKIQDLKEIHLDGIREAANIGGGHAATALGQMLDRDVEVKVPEIEILSIEETPGLLELDDGIVVAALTKFFGDATGRNMLVIGDDNAKSLVSLLTNKDLSESDEIDEIGISSLKEIANILCSSYLSAISEFLGLMLLPSVPSIVRDDFRAVLSSAYLEFSGKEEFVFCVKSIFIFKEPKRKLEAYLLLIPDTDSLDNILKSMNLL